MDEFDVAVGFDEKSDVALPHSRRNVSQKHFHFSHLAIRWLSAGVLVFGLGHVLVVNEVAVGPRTATFRLPVVVAKRVVIDLASGFLLQMFFLNVLLLFNFLLNICQLIR